MSTIFKILVLSLLGQSNLAEEFIGINTDKSVNVFFKSIQNEQIETFFGTNIAHENRSPRGIRIPKKPQFINPGALARPSDVLKNNFNDLNNMKGSNNLKDSHDYQDIAKPDMGPITKTGLRTTIDQLNKHSEWSTASSATYTSTLAITLPRETTMISNQSTTIFDGDLLNTIVKTGSTTIDEFFGRNVTTQSYEDYLSSNFTTTLAAKRFPKHKNDPYGVLDAIETHTFPVMLMIALLLLVTVIMISSCAQMTLNTFHPRKPHLPKNDKEDCQSYANNNASFETKF